MPWSYQITWLPNKSSRSDSFTKEFYKHFYQKNCLPNDFRLTILGNKKMLEKSKNWEEAEVNYQSPLQKQIFGKSNKKLHRSRFQCFFILFNFAWFLYFVSNILSRVVDDYYSWEKLTTMAISSKTGIMPLICRKRDKNNKI